MQDIRSIIVSTVARFYKIPESEVTDDMELGGNAYFIANFIATNHHVSLQAGIQGTVGELIAKNTKNS